MNSSLFVLHSSLNLLFLLQVIKILAAIAKISYSTIGMKLVQKVQINIRNENHLGIRCCLRTLAVVREGEVARSEYGTLGILDIHVVNTRQVAHTTRNGYIALILDGTRLGTNSYSGVSILRIGHERNEENLHAILCH